MHNGCSDQPCADATTGDRDEVHWGIYAELCPGHFEEASRAMYRRVMADFVADGAPGIILGYTEIGLLVGDGDASVPLLDTTVLRAQAALYD